jgi:hypothetical protein
MKKTLNWQKRELALAVALIVTGAAALPSIAQAQDTAAAQTQDTAAVQVAPPQIDEIVVMGRLRDAARSIVMERVEQPFAAEIVGIEQISRAGDSDVAMALRRVTGLTLVDGKYIYVRGLGERYSSATLNGAEIPSPELSRNVIPLDYIPASILESVKFTKPIQRISQQRLVAVTSIFVPVELRMTWYLTCPLARAGILKARTRDCVIWEIRAVCHHPSWMPSTNTKVISVHPTSPALSFRAWAHPQLRRRPAVSASIVI